MANKLITKKIVNIYRKPIDSSLFEPRVSTPEVKAAAKNKKAKVIEEMTEVKDMAALEQSAQALNGQGVKVVKKDRGLIERTESSKIILTEDNRQVLND